MKCSNCGVSEREKKLVDVISGEGIVKLCNDCMSAENVHLNKPKSPAPERDKSNYQRLSRLSGINAKKHKKNVSEEKEELNEQETNLRNLVDKKFDSFVKKKKKKKREDLVDNFHWVILRGRRNKKLTTSQLAKKINEPEKVIKMAEKGIVPEGYDLVKKLENYLGIRIIRPEVDKKLKRRKKQLGFDEMSAKTITISDLKDMKKDKVVSKKKTPYWRRFVSKLINKKEKEEQEEKGVYFEEIGSSNEMDALGDISQVENTDRESADSDDMPVQMEDTSFEMSTDISGEEEEEKEDDGVKSNKSVEIVSQKKQSKKKEELSQKEIDDLIFGRG